MKKIFLVLLILLLPSMGWCATYYVSPTGNDSADGAIGTPWLTPSTSAAKLSAGDTLYFRGGSYTDTAQLDVAAANITLKAYTGETPIVSSPNAINFGDASDGGILDGITFIRSTGATVIVAIGDDHITVQNCDLSYGETPYASGAGDAIRPIGAHANHGILIYNNIIHHCGENGIDGSTNYYDGAGASDGGGEWSVIVRGNTVYDCGSYGIMFKGGADGVLIEKNTVSGCRYGQIDLGNTCTGDVALSETHHVTNAVIRNNYLYGACTYNGMEATYYQAIVLKSVKDVYIYNNTSLLGGVIISRIEDDMYNAAGVLLGNENIYIYNNLFYVTASGPDLFTWHQRDGVYADGQPAHDAHTLADTPASVKPTSLYAAYNIFVNLAAGTTLYKENNTDGAISWATFSTNNPDLVGGSTQYTDGNTTVKLDGVASGSEDLDLQSDSPLINAGNNKIGSTSKNGKPRPSGHGMDIGAYEVEGGMIR